MTRRLIKKWQRLAAAVGVLSVLVAAPASAQITTASVTGTVRDNQGGVIPGATVTLVSATRGTPLEMQSSTDGDFVFPTVQADTYTVKVVLPGFKTYERQGVVVHAGDRVAIGNIPLEVGTLEETVTVSGEAPMIQSQSGERSYAISAEAVKNIAINGRSFNNLQALAPGMVAGTVNGSRTNQNNYQVDGVSTVDTGCNCTSSMVSLTVDSVQEVKILTSNYQAEYGRAAGAQISAVTKSGGQEFHGTLYADRRKDDLNANTWLNKRDGLAKPRISERDFGYTLGGPVGKPGSKKLFFFWSQEYQPRSQSVAVIRLRVPTALERQGDFSQTLDNNGNLFPYVRDYTTGLACSATDTRGCFQDGGVIGRIPQNRLYDVGLNILKMYPEANSAGTITQGYNYSIVPPNTDNPRRQDLIRLDYQASSSWRFNGKILQSTGHTATASAVPGLLSTYNPKPGNWLPSLTVDGTLNSTTVFEATYGMAENWLGTLTANGDKINKDALGLTNFPLLFPNAAQIPTGSYAADLLDGTTGWINNGKINLPPSFTYGSRVANQPPNYNVGTFGGAACGGCAASPFVNINRTQDFVASVTRLMGRHTGKAGFYFTHSRKAQSAFGNPEANVSFANDASNPFDTGFGYANAITGIYSTYTQSSAYLVPDWVYNNAEWYMQDNWKASNRLTLDLGLRFYWIQPQHDTLGITANFLPDKYVASKAQRLYYPAVVNGTRVGVDRVTGETVQAAYIGRLVPNSGDLLNGVFAAGKGIDKYLYKNRGIQYSPRFGFAYDLNGDQTKVLRGGTGMFYNRERGDTVYQLVTNPPYAIQSTLNNGRLQDITSSATPVLAPPALSGFNYDGPIPTTVPWNVGIQMALRWSSALDVSYVGSYAYNQTQLRNINAPDYGAAFLAANQDPTVGQTCSGCVASSTTPGANSLTVDFLRPYQGYGDILMVEQKAISKYHSLQTSFNRRMTRGLSFGVNYTLGRAMGTSSTDLPAAGIIGAPRNDANQKKANYMPLDFDRRHTLVTNFVWVLPGVSNKTLGAALNGWQLSGVLTAGSGAPYTVSYSIPGITARNLTGAQGLESARVVLTGDPGSGCSKDPYKQFNTSAFTTPQSGSLGLESGLNYMRGCADHTLNLSLSRSVQVGRGRRFEVRIDAFNALNSVIITNRNAVLNVTSFTNSTPTNLAEDASGNLIPANIRGFGAVTGVAAPRTMQLTARFQF
jgi:Carboxypeptidase regulatory-like domain